MLDSQATAIYDVDGAAISQNPGSAAPASALQVAGSDGANLQALATDTSGRQVAVGAAAAGAAVDGNPVLVGVSDGTNAQYLRSDANGRLEMVGAAADGSPAVGAPVQVGGKDGNGDAQALLTDTSGRLEVNTAPTTASTATPTNVAASASSVALLAANPSRLGAIIVNDSPSKLYAKMGATASTTSFSVLIPANGYWEVPFSYTGQIDGIWTAANGDARITELTA